MISIKWENEQAKITAFRLAPYDDPHWSQSSYTHTHIYIYIEIQIIEKKRQDAHERQSMERLHMIDSIPFEIKVLSTSLQL
jgi:hypothetical protein